MKFLTRQYSDDQKSEATGVIRRYLAIEGADRDPREGPC